MLARIAKNWLQNLYVSAVTWNQINIVELMKSGGGRKLLDLGCDDGIWTKKMAEAVGAAEVFGVEIVSERAATARHNGVNVTIGDLAQKLPVSDSQFDLVHANQVIEHVPDIDLFAEEIYRVLRPGGHAVISTENASSWHNVFAAILGWQMFSLTNLSARRLGIGNPLALHRGDSGHLKSWTHKVIFSYRGLAEFFEAHGFEVVCIKGAGYYPLPSRFGRWDVRHAHFLTILVRKPAANGGVTKAEC